MKIFITLLTVLVLATSNLRASCDKCDIDKVKRANDNLDRLTQQIVSDFLCTFDTFCQTNVEYSEWSNEVLFLILAKEPLLFLKVISKENVDNAVILSAVESPIRDFDLLRIYKGLKAAPLKTDLKAKYLNAIIVAAGKDNITIKE